MFKASLAILLLVSSYRVSVCGNIAEVNLNESQPLIGTDSILTNRLFGNFKIDPLQLFLSSEIAASFEFYFLQNFSLNVQVGYIFPAWKGCVRRGLYESYGENGNAKTKGFFITGIVLIIMMVDLI